jgi:hypothetical protein
VAGFIEVSLIHRRISLQAKSTLVPDMAARQEPDSFIRFADSEISTAPWVQGERKSFDSFFQEILCLCEKPKIPRDQISARQVHHRDTETRRRKQKIVLLRLLLRVSVSLW